MREVATAVLSGNVTHEVELRELPSGTDVAGATPPRAAPAGERGGVGRQGLTRRGRLDQGETAAGAAFAETLAMCIHA